MFSTGYKEGEGLGECVACCLLLPGQSQQSDNGNVIMILLMIIFSMYFDMQYFFVICCIFDFAGSGYNSPFVHVFFEHAMRCGEELPFVDYGSATDGLICILVRPKMMYLITFCGNLGTLNLAYLWKDMATRNRHWP